MQRILVTGARGFVGARVMQLLASQNRMAVAFEGDICKPNTFRPCDDIAVVIHAAALITHKGEVSTEAYAHVNVVGTQNLLVAYPQQKFVFVSTTDVLRAQLSPYAKSKLDAEGLIQGRANHCIVRLPSVFGPNQTQKSKLIPKLLRQHFLGAPAFEVNDDVRSYCFVEDAAAAVVSGIDGLGTVEAPAVQISNEDLVILVKALQQGVDVAQVPQAQRYLYAQLKLCAQALTLPGGMVNEGAA